MSTMAPYLLVALVVMIWVSNIHASIHHHHAADAAEGAYLYRSEDSPPVLDQGTNGHDFMKSTAPKVVEFYDPRCGACQAFKSNYVEVAKRVQASKPNVEFYGVSCEVHPTTCEQYGGTRVPRIYAFPNGADSSFEGGLEVQKGAGTIYFLSTRLIKALRTPEEIASDGKKLVPPGEAEADGASQRRKLEEEDTEWFTVKSEDEEEIKGPQDEDAESGEEDDDEDEESEDKSAEAQPTRDRRAVKPNMRGPPPIRDQNIQDNTEVEEDPGTSDDKLAMNEEALDTIIEERAQQIAKKKLREDAMAEKRAEDRAQQRAEQRMRESQAKLSEIKKNQGKQQLRRPEGFDGDKKRPRKGAASADGETSKAEETSRLANMDTLTNAHKNTDAYKNTVKHFHQIDKKESKPKGYHYDEWKKESEEKTMTARDKLMRKNNPPDQGGIEGSKDSGEDEDDEEEAKPRNGDEVDEEIPPYAKSAFGEDGAVQGDGAGRKPNSGPIALGQKGKPSKWIPPPPPRDSMPVGGDIFVPNPFNTDPVRAKKFQEYVARRKEMQERREKYKHPIKAIMGGDKDEKEDIAALHKKKSPMNNYKSQFTPNQPKPKAFPDLRAEAQQKSLREKMLKKIPIVKRAFKRSKGEETLNDAALSFTRGLLMGVFKTNQPLDYKKKAALQDWFDLLRVSLPPEIGLHELLDTLKYNIDTVSQRQENLVLIINKHPLPDNLWSDSCTKASRGGGFFCGFWKLLHVMSVGFAEQAGGLALQETNPNTRIFSAHEAGDIVREYMALFFNCAKCSQRFVAQYDDCSFQVCDRLSTVAVGAPAISWQEFPIWLWQVHNDISRSKLNRAVEFHEKAGRKAEAKMMERNMQAVYPNIDQCIKCVTGEGMWNLNHVYNHLETEYWTFGVEETLDPKMEKLLEYNDIEKKKVSHGLSAYVLVSLIALLGLFARRQRIKVTGRHKKKDESETAPFVTRSSFDTNRRTKYRDS